MKAIKQFMQAYKLMSMRKLDQKIPFPALDGYLSILSLKTLSNKTLAGFSFSLHPQCNRWHHAIQRLATTLIKVNVGTPEMKTVSTYNTTALFHLVRMTINI